MTIVSEGNLDVSGSDDSLLESFIDGLLFMSGADPLDDCADDPADDANPADFNNDASFTGFDLSAVAADIGQTVPPAPARKNIAPDPPDGAITGADLSAVAGRIGQTCT